jgi:hypothetical protein
MKVIRSLGGAAIARSRGFLRSTVAWKLLLYGVPILAILWALAERSGSWAGSSRSSDGSSGRSCHAGRPVLPRQSRRALGVWIFYSASGSDSAGRALAALKNFLSGLRAVAGRDPGHAVGLFKRAVRWARLVPDTEKVLPELPDLLGQSQARLALALAETGELEEGMRVLLRARVNAMSKETRRALDEAQALQPARGRAGEAHGDPRHPRSAPLLRELRERLVRSGRFERRPRSRPTSCRSSREGARLGAARCRDSISSRRTRRGAGEASRRPRSGTAEICRSSRSALRAETSRRRPQWGHAVSPRSIGSSSGARRDRPPTRSRASRWGRRGSRAALSTAVTWTARGRPRSRSISGAEPVLLVRATRKRSGREEAAKRRYAAARGGADGRRLATSLTAFLVCDSNPWRLRRRSNCGETRTRPLESSNRRSAPSPFGPLMHGLGDGPRARGRGAEPPAPGCRRRALHPPAAGDR